MIPLWMIITGALAVIGTGLYICDTWDDFLDWLDGMIGKISDALKAAAIATGSPYLEVIAEWIDAAHAALKVYIYARESNKKMQEKREAQVPIDELPANVRKKLRRVGDSADISDELNLTI